MAKDKNMALKHAKARKEGLKAALEMENIKGSAGKYNPVTSKWFFAENPYATTVKPLALGKPARVPATRTKSIPSVRDGVLVW